MNLPQIISPPTGTGKIANQIRAIHEELRRVRVMASPNQRYAMTPRGTVYERPYVEAIQAGGGGRDVWL
jgi:hypothetical protein